MVLRVHSEVICISSKTPSAPSNAYRLDGDCTASAGVYLHEAKCAAVGVRRGSMAGDLKASAARQGRGGTQGEPHYSLTL